MRVRKARILLCLLVFTFLFSTAPVAQAATGDYITVSVSDNGGAFRPIWEGISLDTFSYTSIAVPTASGSHNCEYKIEHKNILRQTQYSLSNYLSWKWASGKCTVVSRHYHQTSPGGGWSFEDLHGNTSGTGTGYCYSKYKAHFHWEAVIPPGVPVSAEAYPGLNVKGNLGGTHSASSY